MAVMSVIVFAGIYSIGNPLEILIPPEATQDVRERTIARFGLDRPVVEQYFLYIRNLFQGDLGRSYIYNEPVLYLISGRLPATIELVLVSVLGALFIGVPLGMLAGYRPDALSSRIIMAVSILGFSVPTFWVGLILILTFAVELGWLPSGGRGDTAELFGTAWSFLTLNGWSHLALPAINLALFKLAIMIRLARAGTREVMLGDTVKFARASARGAISACENSATRSFSSFCSFVSAKSIAAPPSMCFRFQYLESGRNTEFKSIPGYAPAGSLAVRAHHHATSLISSGLMSSKTVPALTIIPGETCTALTTPSAGAVRVCTSFIASICATLSPFFTLWPGVTKTLVTVPGSGAVTALPLGSSR